MSENAGTVGDVTDSVEVSADTLPEPDEHTLEAVSSVVGDFRRNHTKEWNVLNQCKACGENYSKVDTLVREYIRSEGINLPENKYQQIEKIHEICDSCFYTYGDLDSGPTAEWVGENYLLFKKYNAWLLRSEAYKVSGTGINLQDELTRIKPVIDALRECCSALSGTGWYRSYGPHMIASFQIRFEIDMYKCVLNPQPHDTMPFRLTARYFQNESAARMRGYSRAKDRGHYDGIALKSIQRLLDQYCTSIKKWMDYRNHIVVGIANPAIRVEYSFITRSAAKELYVHLKNAFFDLNVDSYDGDWLLPIDCSDKEMLEYDCDKLWPALN